MIQRLSKSKKKFFFSLIVIIFLVFIGSKRSGSGSGSGRYQTTVISEYFKIKKSKHSDLEYQSWIKNILISVKSPLILFTDNNSISNDLLELRKNLTTKLYIYSSHWEILKEIEKKKK